MRKLAGVHLIDLTGIVADEAAVEILDCRTR
jgi:hypothetical protein